MKGFFNFDVLVEVYLKLIVMKYISSERFVFKFYNNCINLINV